MDIGDAKISTGKYTPNFDFYLTIMVKNLTYKKEIYICTLV